MKSGIETYDSKAFRDKYFNASPELDKLFEQCAEDFFCLRIEDVSENVLKPILPSREESHTIIYVTEGSYLTRIGFEEYTIETDQIVILQAGAVFSTPQISSKVKGFACHFHPDILIGKFGNHTLITDFEFLNVGNHPIINVKSPSKPAIRNLFERLYSEFSSAERPNPTIVHSYIYALLAELQQLYGKHNPSNQRASFQITSHFRKLAYQKAKENLKIVDFAEMMNISPNHLNKSVKDITAKSASELYDEVKLIEIKFLLYQSGLSISEIAYEMGYLDTSYFTRFFKKHTNTSPRKFRDLIEKS